MNPSTTASPSPTFPLIILGLVLFMVMAPWFMSSEPAVEEAVQRAKGLAAPEALILIPAVILIFVQFYGSYESGIRWKLPHITMTDSVMALVGFVLIVFALMWMRSSVKEMIQSL